MINQLLKNDTFKTVRETINEIIDGLTSLTGSAPEIVSEPGAQPNPSDNDYEIGDFWINTDGGATRLFLLVAGSGGIADWRVIYSSDIQERRDLLDVYSKAEVDSIDAGIVSLINSNLASSVTSSNNIIASLNEGGDFIQSDFNDPAWVGTVNNGGTPTHDYFAGSFEQPINNNGYHGDVVVKASMSNQTGGTGTYNIKTGSTILSSAIVDSADLTDQLNLSSSPETDRNKIFLLKLNIPEANVNDPLVLEFIVSGTVYVESVEFFPIANDFYPSALATRFETLEEIIIDPLETVSLTVDPAQATDISLLRFINLAHAIDHGKTVVRPMGLIDITVINSGNHGFNGTLDSFTEVNVRIASDIIGTQRSLAAPGSGDGGATFIDSKVEITDIRFRDCTRFAGTRSEVILRNVRIDQSGFSSNAVFQFIDCTFTINGDVTINRTSQATESFSIAGLALENCVIKEGVFGGGQLWILCELIDGLKMTNCRGFIKDLRISKNNFDPKTGIVAENGTMVGVETFTPSGLGVATSPALNTFGNFGSRISTTA